MRLLASFVHSTYLTLSSLTFPSLTPVSLSRPCPGAALNKWLNVVVQLVEVLAVAVATVVRKVGIEKADFVCTLSPLPFLSIFNVLLH